MTAANVERQEVWSQGQIIDQTPQPLTSSDIIISTKLQNIYITFSQECETTPAKERSKI
jgi:hypothetical protein